MILKNEQNPISNQGLFETFVPNLAATCKNIIFHKVVFEKTTFGKVQHDGWPLCTIQKPRTH